MISSSIKKSGSGLVQIRRIEAAKEIAETLSKAGNVMYLPNGQNMLLQMPGMGGRAVQ